MPKENLIGEEGGGFKVAMKTFDRSRPWIAAGAAGIIRRALDESRAYALERKTFGVPIAQHQAVQFMLAEMAIAYETTRLLYMKASWMVDSGKLDSIVSSYAKAYGADAAMRVTTDAVQIFGGYGYTKEYPVEKLMRDAKLLQIYEGTSQIQRMVIAKNLLAREVALLDELEVRRARLLAAGRLVRLGLGRRRRRRRRGAGRRAARVLLQLQVARNVLLPHRAVAVEVGDEIDRRPRHEGGEGHAVERQRGADARRRRSRDRGSAA